MPWGLLLPIFPNKWVETLLRWKGHKGLRGIKFFFFFFKQTTWAELWNLLPYDITRGNTAATFEQLYYRNYESMYDVMVLGTNVFCSTRHRFSEFCKCRSWFLFQTTVFLLTENKGRKCGRSTNWMHIRIHKQYLHFWALALPTI